MPAPRAPDPSQEISSRARKDRPAIHPLVAGVEPLFLKARERRYSYLLPGGEHLVPFKKTLPDILVTRETLTRALAVANELYLTLEDRGHRVILSPPGIRFHRAEVDLREKGGREQWSRDAWRPVRLTFVYVGTLPIGLTLYEMTEEVETLWIGDKKVRASEVPAQTRRRLPTYQSQPRKDDLASGRLCLQAYSPDGRVKWQKQWVESKRGDLDSRLLSIAKELEGEAPRIVTLVEKGRQEAEQERIRWQEEMREGRRKDEEERRVAAREASRKDLLSIVESWALAARIDAFFNDAKARLQGLGAERQAALRPRLEAARAMLGGVDALARLEAWKSPEERFRETPRPSWLYDDEEAS